jgi:ferric-dicitrate binding protein FerR (iron transport regulator)
MKFCAQLDRYCDGELESERRAAFESHLEVCEECRGRIAKWSEIAHEIDLITRENEEALPAFSEALAQRLMERAGSRTQRRQGFAIGLRPALAFAAALVVIATVFILTRAPKPDRSPDSTPDQREEASAAIAARLIRADEPGSLPLTASLNIPLEAPQNGRVLVSLGQDEIGMASRSRLNIRKSTKEYTLIELERGTAVFSVSPRGERGEFVVKADHLEVRVVGTRFAVSLERGKTEVSVMEGTVEAVTGENRAFPVRAGQRFLVSSESDVSMTELSERYTAILMNILSEDIVEGRIAEAEDTAEQAGANEVDSGEFRQTREKPRKTGSAHYKSSIDTWRDWVIGGRFDEASRAIVEHLQQKPKDGDAWSLLADCRRKSGDWRGAVDAYRKVIALGPANQAEQARFRAGALLQDKLHAHSEAIELLDEYVNSGAGDNMLTAEALYRLAKSHLALGHRDRAMDLLEEVVERHRGSSAAAGAHKLIEKIKSDD